MASTTTAVVQTGHPDRGYSPTHGMNGGYSDLVNGYGQEDGVDGPVQEEGDVRHGFDSSEEVLRELESRYFLYYTDVSRISLQSSGRKAAAFSKIKPFTVDAVLR